MVGRPLRLSRVLDGREPDHGRDLQLAHCVEEADFASLDDLVTKRRLWAVHEVETTVNFCPHNRVLSWLAGGLNYQIEHHLFPRVPHTHYGRIAEIVQRNAEVHGVRYVSQQSLRAALRSHFRHLRTMGRMGTPTRSRWAERAASEVPVPCFNGDIVLTSPRSGGVGNLGGRTLKRAERVQLEAEQHAPDHQERHHRTGHVCALRRLADSQEERDDGSRQGRVHRRHDRRRVDEEMGRQPPPAWAIEHVGGDHASLVVVVARGEVAL